MTAGQPIELDYAIHPGELLADTLERQGVRQSELAERTGLSAKHINQMIKQSIGVSTDVAILLERALGVPADIWMAADSAYQMLESRKRDSRVLDQYRAWADKFDRATLVRNKIVDSADGPISRVEKILKLFQVANPAAFEQTWQRPSVSFRRSQAFTISEPNTALWLRLVERAADDVAVEPYNPRILRKVAPLLPAMTAMSVPNGFVAARTALAQAGVALTFIREVPHTRVCAATWWINGDRPAIGITERHRRIDIFWFNLIHEVGHIIRHPRRTTFLNLDNIDSTDPAEAEANAFADGLLFPGDVSVEIANARRHQDLILIAARLGIGVPTVAGRYAKLTSRWDMASRLRERITEDDIASLEASVSDVSA